jgi:hypothetical protein
MACRNLPVYCNNAQHLQRQNDHENALKHVVIVPKDSCHDFPTDSVALNVFAQGDDGCLDVIDGIF